jgi:hypothetical protein
VVEPAPDPLLLGCAIDGNELANPSANTSAAERPLFAIFLTFIVVSLW